MKLLSVSTGFNHRCAAFSSGRLSRAKAFIEAEEQVRWTVVFVFPG
ncbi:hypothetical protein L195_g008161, partial [Trifolium pratense]